MSLYENSPDQNSGTQPDNTKLWMVPFADLMSVLMILFLVLYAYAALGKNSAVDQALAQVQKELAATPEEAEKFDLKKKEAELAAKLAKELEAELSKESFGIQLTSNRIKVTFASPVLFRSGSATLRPQIRTLLGILAAAFKDMPNDIMIEGHTDNVPIKSGKFKTNWELSAARSFAVIEFFIKQDMNSSRFFTYGYGEHRPVTTNTTREGRARNRRIEISLIRKE